MYMAKQSCHLMAARIQRKRGCIPISPSRAHLPWYHFFPLDPEGLIASQWDLYWFLFCSYGEVPWPVPTGSRGRSAMEGKTWWQALRAETCQIRFHLYTETTSRKWDEGTNPQSPPLPPLRFHNVSKQHHQQSIHIPKTMGLGDISHPK